MVMLTKIIIHKAEMATQCSEKDDTSSTLLTLPLLFNGY